MNPISSIYNTLAYATGFKKKAKMNLNVDASEKLVKHAVNEEKLETKKAAEISEAIIATKETETVKEKEKEEKNDSDFDRSQWK